MLLDALMTWTATQLRRLAATAVSEFAGMEPGRPVGGTYYLYRTLRQLDLDDLGARLMGARARPATSATASSTSGSQREEYDAPAEGAQGADRGGDPPPAGRRPRRRGDGAHAAQAACPRTSTSCTRRVTRCSRCRRAIYPLTRALAARLAQRRRRRHRGTLDFRKTVRALDVVRRRARRAEVQATRTRRSPRSWSSPTSPARSRASPGSRCSSCTRWRASSRRCARGCSSTASTRSPGSSRSADDVSEAVHRVNTEADVVWVDGHSDYGHAFEVFHERHLHEVTPKTSIILLGDARNNYHASQAWVLERAAQARASTCTGSTPSRAATGTPATRSSPSTAVLRRRLRVPQPPPAPAVRRPPSPRADATRQLGRRPQPAAGGSRRGRRCGRARAAARARAGGTGDRPPDEDRGIVRALRRATSEVLGPGRAVDAPSGRPPCRRRARRGTRPRVACRRRRPRARVADQQRGPVGEELATRAVSTSTRCSSSGVVASQSVAADSSASSRGSGKASTTRNLLDRRAVDLLDLAHEELEQRRGREHDRELVDGDAFRALEHVDADDVAADGADARRDEAERTGPVGQPDPDEDMGLGRLGHERRVRSRSDGCVAQM